MDDYYYEEDYADINDYDDGFNGDDGENTGKFIFDHGIKFQYENIYETCIQTSLVQVAALSALLLFWNLIFRVLTQTKKTTDLFNHVISILCGLAILYQTVGFGCLYLIALAAVNYILILIIHHFNIKNYGWIFSGFCLSILIFCELVEPNPKLWHKIRGLQMIAAMKIISLGFDFELSKKLCSKFKWYTYFGYLMSPCNSVFGPWISFSDYLLIFEKPKWHLKWLFNVTWSMIISSLFVVFSNCLIPGTITDNWKWLEAYRDAMAFRFSHYFVSFMSQMTLLAGGGGGLNENDNFCLITQPLFIELPRSLVDVVITWNRPMHIWLKQYIFLPLKNYGRFTSIFGTYAVSALLHGLNFQLGAVLLSLGLSTYIEYCLRNKLGIIFNACILTKKCTFTCGHLYKKNQPYVILCNTFFSCIAIFNLMYLGVMFDASSAIQEEGYSYINLFSKWSHLNFAGHLLMIFLFFFYWLI